MKSIDRIEVCFPAELAQRLHTLIATGEWRYGWRSNKSMGYAHWNRDFASAGPENGLDIQGNLRNPIVQEAWNYLQSVYFPNTALLRCYANAHTYGIEGYPHTDSNREHDRTIVVYLNQQWRREWGGETAVYDGDTVVYTELPKFNKGLVFYGDQYHAARPVGRLCPDLRMTLMFKFAPANIDPLRDRIQVFLASLGTNNTKHTTGTLMQHLLRTYDLLRQKNSSDSVCAAGAVHSIFGTNAFKTATLTPDRQDRVSDIVGTEATRLALLFSQIARPQTLVDAVKNQQLTLKTNSGETITVDQTTLDNLVLIEAANLADQSALAKYPAIQQIWTELKG